MGVRGLWVAGLERKGVKGDEQAEPIEARGLRWPLLCRTSRWVLVVTGNSRARGKGGFDRDLEGGGVGKGLRGNVSNSGCLQTTPSTRWVAGC